MIQVEVKRKRPNQDIAFRSEHAKITCIFGPKNSGKTSLAHMVAGLIRPDQGLIRIGDLTLFDSNNGINLRPEQRRIGYVFQGGCLFPHMSVRKNLLYGTHSQVQSISGLKDVVGLLGIKDILKYKPRDLETAMMRLVAIGRALLSNPRLLLLDEPLADLDQTGRREIMVVIDHLRDELGIPILLISRNLDDVFLYADTLVVLDRGKVAAAGPTEALVTDWDLLPLAQHTDAGSLLSACITGHDNRANLSQLEMDGGHQIAIPLLPHPVGRRIRIRIRARDVILSLSPPDRISMSNQLEGTITEIRKGKAAYADVMIDIGRPLWARIAQKSVNDLGLMPGIPIYALVEAMAIEGH